MFKSKKMKYIGSVIKLFKVISSKEVRQFSVPLKEIIEFFKRDVGDDYGNVEINYGTKQFKKAQSLYSFIEENRDYPITYLSYYGKKSSNNNLVYSNNLLNQVVMDDFGLIDFTFCLNDILVDGNYVIDFANEIYHLFDFDYGYAFHLEKNQDVGTEEKIKKSLFSTSVSVTNGNIEEYNRLKKVNVGYLPKLRQFNILNEKQVRQSNIDNAKKINEKLYFHTGIGSR